MSGSNSGEMTAGSIVTVLRPLASVGCGLSAVDGSLEGRAANSVRIAFGFRNDRQHAQVGQLHKPAMRVRQHADISGRALREGTARRDSLSLV